MVTTISFFFITFSNSLHLHINFHHINIGLHDPIFFRSNCHLTLLSYQNLIADTFSLNKFANSCQISFIFPGFRCGFAASIS